jgi:hypothetical protein
MGREARRRREIKARWAALGAVWRAYGRMWVTWQRWRGVIACWFGRHAVRPDCGALYCARCYKWSADGGRVWGK